MDARKLIDPELAHVPDLIPEILGEITRENLIEVRAMLVEMGDLFKQDIEEVNTLERTIPAKDGDIRVYISKAAGDSKKRPCLLWIHGGGYILGNGDDPLGPVFAQRLGCIVVSVDYRLAPEHPFPAGPEDCHDALLWIHANANSLGVDRNHIGIGGTSAGAGMSAGVALMNRDRKGPELSFQFLMYPMLDNMHDSVSGGLENHALWNRRTSFNAWEMYLNGTPGLQASPYAAASRATDLRGLPPTYITVGGQDLFRDECINYAQRLMAASVPTQLDVFPGVFHSAEMLAPEARVSRRMVQCMFAALEDLLNSQES